MEKVTIELPQLNLVQKSGSWMKYLERFGIDSGKPKAVLTFQEDSKEDPRIIVIKYQIPDIGIENNIFYYSEKLNRYSIVTFNLGFNYQGRVLALDKNNHKLGMNLEHLPKEGLRRKHIDKINDLEDISENLTPDYVSKRYKDFFYNLPKFG
jgi:hypothetical protein